MAKMTNIQLKQLAAMPDETIDYSDIPETKNFTGWVRVGKKGINAAIQQSIQQQNLKVDWKEINTILNEIHKTNSKDRVSLRLDSDIAAYYKKQGRGYQTRINDILRAFMITEQRVHSKLLKSPDA